MSQAYDEFASKSAFRKICKFLINLKNPEIRELEKALHKNDYQCISGVSQFQYADLYRVLMLSPIAKNYCLKQRISSWDELVSRYLWKEGSDDWITMSDVE